MAQPSSTSSSDPGRLARAVWLTLTCVLVVELALTFVPENVMIRTMRQVRALLASTPAPAIQIHGDSVAQGALLASEIETELPAGVHVTNASLQGSGPEFTYFLYKHQIESGHVPGAIVIAHSPHTFTTERMGELVGAFLGWRDVPEALFQGHHFFDALYGVLCKLSFTLRHRGEIATMIKEHRVEGGEQWNDPIPTEAWVRKAGADAEAKWAHQAKAPLGPLHPVYLRPFVLDPAEREFLARTLALAREHHVHVYWLTLPEHVAVAAARESLGFAPAYAAFVDSLAARGEVSVLRRDFEVLPADAFSDYTHLRLPAALALSREVGREIAPSLAGATPPVR